MSNQPEGPFRLVIPSRASHVATARLFVSSFGRALGLHPEVIDDLRLAVSEAVTASVLAETADTVTISGRIDAVGITVRIEQLFQSPSKGPATDQPAFDVGSIVGALFPDSHFDDEGLVIPVSWRPPT